MSDREHPSFFELDCLAAGASVASGVSEHVSGCERCSAHLSQLRHEGELPRWAAESRKAPKKGGKVLALIGGASLAAAAAGLLFVQPRASETRGPSAAEAFTTTRGNPTIGVYVSHDERVALWDGREPLVPGDRIRLQVVREDFAHITVFSADASGKLERLYASELAAAPEVLLPVSWQVDDAPGDERLLVVLSHAPLPEHDLAKLGEPAPGRWSRWLRFVKQKGRP